MKKEGRMTGTMTLAAVMLLLVSSLATFVTTADGPRNPGLDVAAIGFTNQKDIDDPSGSALYPTGNTTVSVMVKNTGDVNSGGFLVGMEVGKGPRSTKFYADAEGTSLPAGWSVTDLTTGRWHADTRSYKSATHSAYCGPEGQAGTQYGAGWEELMQTTSSYQVPSGSPELNFFHLYVTKFATDGGYVSIRDTSISGEQWDQAGPSTWQFTVGAYTTTTASINPISQDTPCFGGDSSGWVRSTINLANYIGKNIQVRFSFSSSSSVSGTLSGWFIDDVTLTNGASTPFSDTFESGMGAWTVMNLLGEVPTAWSLYSDPGPSYNSSSTKCFSNQEAVVNNTYYDGEDSALVTPAIDLSGTTHARLSFWTKIKSQTGYDGGFVEVQKAGGEWNYLKPFMKNYPGILDPDSPYGSAGAFSNNLMDWTQQTMDLSAFTGGNVKARFHFYANKDGTTLTGWYIDDIKVVAWNFVQSGSATPNVPALSIGQTSNASFSFNLSEETYYLLKATTQLPADTNPGNNMAYVIIQVKRVLTLALDFNLTMPVQVAHGRKADIGVIVWNTGNMQNDVELKNSTPPAGLVVTYNRTGLLVNPGAKVLVKMEVAVPIGQASDDYTFRLNASSRLDSASFADKEVSLHVFNNPPTAAIDAPARANVYADVLFNGSRSNDLEDDQLNYTWDFGDGTAGYGEWLTHAFTGAKTYNVTLKVSDGGPDPFGTAWALIAISDNLPEAIIDIDTPINNGTYQKDTEVFFNGSRSRDEAPALLNYTWDFGDNTYYSYDAVASHVFSDGGFFNVTLTVTDTGGQSGVLTKMIRVNNPPSAKIASPANNLRPYTDDEILFSSNGSFDPDGDPLTFLWTDNQLPGQTLSASASFSRMLNITGRHTITLTVFDGKGPVSFNYDQVTIDVQERINLPPVLSNGRVDPPDGDEVITTFRHTVTYSDPNGDVPEYVQVVIDGNYVVPGSMLASDPLDTNYTDGKDYYFNTNLLRGELSPHNFSFQAADTHGSGRVTTEVFVGPTIRWVRDIGKDAYNQTIFPRSKVYQTGPYRTFLNQLTNTTPPEIPTGKVALGLAFVMNSSAPAERWFWANITIVYSGLDYSKLNETTLRIYQSVAGGTWTLVQNSGLDIEGKTLWMNVTSANARYAVFGSPATVGPIHNGKGNETKADNTMYYIAGAVLVAVVVGVVAAVYLRRKPAIPPEPDYQRVDELPVEPKKDRKWAKTEDAERPPAMVGTTGEEVKVFRPAGGEVKVFRPGGEEKVFKPAETEEEEKIFRPGARDEVDEEAVQSPVVDEEAPREKVVEYEEKGEEVEESMPGARPAGEEVEASEESESEAPPEETGKDEPEDPGPSGDGPEAKEKKKTEDESLDDLLDDLNK